MTEEKQGMTAMRLPVEQVDFLRRNPKIAQMAGMVLSKMIELRDMQKEFEELLANSNNFMPVLESGTKEELELFLKTAVIYQNETVYLPDVPEDKIPEITKALGRNALVTMMDEN